MAVRTNKLCMKVYGQVFVTLVPAFLGESVRISFLILISREQFPFFIIYHPISKAQFLCSHQNEVTPGH